MRLLLLELAPLLVVPIVFIAVLRAGSPEVVFPRHDLPDESFVASHCTWACHNRGCHHASRLPSLFVSDRYLFGWAVGALHRMGDALRPSDTFAGYGIVNLAIFCAAWPASMFALWTWALQLRARRLALQERATTASEPR